MSDLSAGRVILPVEPDTSKFSANLGKGVTSGLSGIAKIGATVGKVAFGAVALTGGVLAGMALKGGISRALNIDDAKRKLEGLGHSAGSIDKIMTSALDSVRGTAFGLDAAATTAATAVAAGIKPGKELTKYLSLTADAATIAGTDLGSMGQIMNQATTSGKVYTDTLNQLAGRGIPIFTYLQKEYGVSGAELSKMVKEGKVDSETFRRVLEENIGGAAASSGASARGSFKNVQAAFSRMGAAFVQPAVNNAPVLFNAISRTVDKFTAALKPLIVVLGVQLADAFAALAKWMDGINFDALQAKITVIAGAIRQFFIGFKVDPEVAKNLAEPGDKFAAMGQKVRAILAGIVPFIQSAFAKIKGAIDSFSKGGLDLGGLGNIGKVISPILPILASFGKAIGNLGGTLGTALGQTFVAALPLLVSLLNLLAGALGFVGDNMGVIAPFLPLIIGGIILWTSAGKALVATNQLITVAEAAQLPIRLANNIARTQAARSEIALTLAKSGSTGATTAQSLATVRGTIALVAQRVAMVAMRGVQIAATAAQWLFNAALSANPIGIIIVLIAALVAGLIWFFTQTKVGQAIVQTVMAAIGAAFTWIGQVAATVWGAVTAAFQAAVAWIQGAIATVVGFIRDHWQLLIAIFLGPLGIIIDLVVTNFGAIKAFISSTIQNILNVITTVVNAIKAVWTNVWNAILGFFKTLIAAIVAVYGPPIRAILTVISGVINGIKSVWTSVWNNILSFFRSLWAAIVAVYGPPIRAILTVISGVIKNVQSVWTSTWNAIKGVITTVWNGIKTGVQNGITAVVKFVTGIKDKVLGALKGAATWLVSIGADVINGLVKGISDGISAVTSAIGKVAGAIAPWAAKILGIKSPSRVFITIGRFINEGLIKGLNGNADQVQSATTKLVNMVVDSFRDLAAKREASQKKLDKLDAEYKTANAKRRVTLSKQIADERENMLALARTSDLSAKQRAAVVNSLREDNAALVALAKARDGIAKDLKAAQDKLIEAVKVRDDFAASVSSGITGKGDVSSLYGAAAKAAQDATDSIADLRDKIANLNSESDSFVKDKADLETQLAAATAAAGTNPVSVVISNLQQQVKDAQEFTGLLATLKAKGLNNDSYSQLVAGGVEAGLVAARGLAADGSGAIGTINDLQAQLKVAGDNLGTSTATVLYQNGVTLAQGVVNGIQSQLDNVNQAMGLVERNIAVQAGKVGVKNKVLMKEAGKDITAGLVKGLKEGKSDIVDSVSDLGSAVVKALKKALDIKSPSRVMRKLGVFTHMGFALGIRDGRKVVKAESSALASIPAAVLPTYDVPAYGQAGGGFTPGFATAPPIVNNFNGPMGFTEDQVADHIVTRQRRAQARVPNVKVL